MYCFDMEPYIPDMTLIVIPVQQSALFFDLWKLVALGTAASARPDATALLLDNNTTLVVGM